jgi:hypothetical protein
MSTQLNSSNGNLQCGFCFQPIEDNLNIHHVQPKSAGGTNQASNLIPAHVDCHRLHHSTPNGADGLSDFQRWGKLASLTCAWAFQLKGVKSDPAYEPARQFYLMFYAKPQPRKEMQ